jgi:choline dehydrogenase-like flavoprotein
MQPETTLETEVLIVGSGAGGATTAARLAEAGRSVMVVEEGPWIEPDAVEPFSIEEMILKYRHRGASATLGAPPVAYVEGRCVGGSTEINSGLWHRLPDYLAHEWRSTYQIDEFSDDVLDRYAAEVEDVQSVSRLPKAPPPSSATLERGATKLGWRAVEFPRVFRYDQQGRGVKQTMARSMIPRALAAGANVVANCRVLRLERTGRRITGAQCERTREDGTVERLLIRADHVFVCAGAIYTPALLQRSRIRSRAGAGLKLHPTIKIAARFPQPLDHAGVPMHRITEFAPSLTIGGSISRRGHIALGLADSDADTSAALEDWERVFVYYAAIRGDASGYVVTVPGLRAPVVLYRLTDGDLSRIARGLVHLGEVLLAAGATELYPSVIGGRVVRHTDELASWWDAVTRNAANLQTVHMTSTVRMGENRSATAADSFGRVWGYDNLLVNDASLLPDAPGVNPQAAIMTIAARNADRFLAG